MKAKLEAEAKPGTRVVSVGVSATDSSIIAFVETEGAFGCDTYVRREGRWELIIY